MIDKIYDKNGKLIVHYKRLPKGNKFKSYDNRGFEKPPTSDKLSVFRYGEMILILPIVVGILTIILCVFLKS
jgi:hypothetical protein